MHGATLVTFCAIEQHITCVGVIPGDLDALRRLCIPLCVQSMLVIKITPFKPISTHLINLITNSVFRKRVFKMSLKGVNHTPLEYALIGLC